MVSFARARTKSLLLRLWPVIKKNLSTQSVEMQKSNKLIKDIDQQNKCFIEASKNGGMWFT